MAKWYCLDLRVYPFTLIYRGSGVIVTVFWDREILESRISVEGFMKRSFLVVMMIFFAVLSGCGEWTDSFLKFNVDGKAYAVSDPVFTVVQIKKSNLHFLDLTQASVSAIPGVAIQWRMDFEDIDSLVGKNIDLDEVNAVDTPAIMSLVMDEDLSLFNDQESKVHVQIDSIREGHAAGTFSGKNLVYVSKTKDVVRRVDVSGEFKVKLKK